MKWKNKGHEFDAMHQEIEKKNRFYLFGAGDYGAQFYSAFHKEWDFCGYIDNDLKNRERKSIIYPVAP